MNTQASPATLIIAAMITPALLILGSASLVATALQRLARAVDRARALMYLSPDEAARYHMSSERLGVALSRYAERSMVAERAVTVYFLAVGTFVLACLSIAIDRYFDNRLTWLPVGLTITGMLFLVAGAYLMVRESQIAGTQIREEIIDSTKRPGAKVETHA